MALFLARRWRQQPQGPVEVDWSHPLSNDLIYFHRLAALRGYAPELTAPSAAQAIRKHAPDFGFGIELTRQLMPLDSEAYGVRQALPASWRAITTAFVVTNTGNNGSSWRGFGGAVTTGGHNGPTFGADPSGNLRCHPSSVTDTGIFIPTDAGRQVIGILGYVNGGVTFYVNRAPQEGSIATNRIGDGPTVFRPVYGSFRSDAPGEVYPYIYHGQAVWGRRLTAGEWLSFQENPWQLLRPLRQTFFSLPAAGGSATYYRPIADISNTGWTRVPA